MRYHMNDPIIPWQFDPTKEHSPAREAERWHAQWGCKGQRFECGNINPTTGNPCTLLLRCHNGYHEVILPDGTSENWKDDQFPKI